jgi:hypothetical protein
MGFGPGLTKISDTTFKTPSGGEGSFTSGASAQVVSSTVVAAIGADKRGVVYLINTDASAVYYRTDGGTASAGGDSTPLPAGKDVFTGLLADVSQVTLFGTGQSVGWALLVPAS